MSLDAWARPDVEQLIIAYDNLFRSSLALSKLKDAAFGGRLFTRSADQDGVAGRSMAWKLFLIPTLPLSPPASQTTAKPPIDALKKLRKDFTELLLEKLRAPDGSYEDGLSIPGVGSLPQSTEVAPNLQRNNPLSLDHDNPWKEWFAAVELRTTIRQDVERTFPDVPYFRDPDVQQQLTMILFVYSTTHPDIGYRQGMHELLAPIFYALDYDSLPEDAECAADVKDLCAHAWVAADAWVLFSVFMLGVGGWYEWRAPPPPPLPEPLRSQFRHGAPEGQGELKPYVAPIVQVCQHIQSALLKSSDPHLWRSMHGAGIEPQIYGIRWLRLLFTREFSLPDAMLIWDGIIASDGTFELVPWLCVAMLIRIRNQLIPSDYSEQLTCLLRYPPPPSTVDPSYHHVNLLLRQAFALQTAPNAATGASIMVENRNLLNIPIDVPRAPPPPAGRRARPGDRRKSLSSAEGRTNGIGPSAGARHRREESSPQAQQMGLPEIIARGLYERGESLGINRTVMNAVSEIRKNLPDLTNSLVRSPNASSSYSSFPLVDERPPEERPPWEPRTRFEIEREIADLRILHKRLADSVGIAVDSLLQDESDGSDPDRLKAIRDRKREAVECLAYVRDVLSGSAGTMEEDRLFPEEEYKKRRDRFQREKDAENAARVRGSDGSSTPLVVAVAPAVIVPQPVAPAPVAPVDRRARSAREIQSQHPLSSLPRTPPLSRGPTEETAAAAFARLGASTIPRRGPSPSSAPLHAPWHYTPSNFSGPAVGVVSLPRPPPRTSSNLSGMPPPRSVSAGSDADTMTDQSPRQRAVGYDPLGVVP